MPLIPHIQPVSAIEASASEHPDDVSTINIRINLDNETAAAVPQPDHINIVVRSPGPTFSTASNDDQTSLKKGLLTLAAKSITPVSGQNAWALKFFTERPVGTDGRVVESVFRASHLGTSVNNGNIAASTGLEFSLRDVRVVDAEGDTDVVVEQFDTAAATAASATQSFTLNKVFPALGIERFVANPAVIQSGEPVTLSWVTKGATEIHLEGLAPEDQTNFDSQYPSATDAKLHAASFPAPNLPPPASPHPLLHPRTTSTYTLRAKNGTAVVTQQVTVVVKDVVVAPAMSVGVFPSLPGAGNLQVQGNVMAGTVTSTGVVNAGSFTTAGSLSASNLTVTGDFVNPLTVIPGLITVDGHLVVKDSRGPAQSITLQNTVVKGGRQLSGLPGEVDGNTDRLLTVNGEMQVRWTTDESQPLGPNPAQEQNDGSVIRVDNPKVLTLSPTQRGAKSNSVHLGFTANSTGAGIVNADGGGVQFKVFDQFFVRWADKDVGVILNRNHVWQSPSDISLKQDIASLDNVLNRVRNLRPVEFTWRDQGFRDQGSKDIGFVAQEVESVFPSLVGAVSTENGGTTKTLPYSSFGVLAIAAVRELASGYEKTIDQLSEKIAGLTARLEKLERTKKKRRDRSRPRSAKGR